MAIDYTDPIGQVRLLITDLSEDPDAQLFSDLQLQAFLAMRGDSVNRAAANALRVMAASEVMVSKVIRTQDRSTDGAKVSAELRALAQTYEDEAGAADAAAAESVFEIVPLYAPAKPEGAEYQW